VATPVAGIREASVAVAAQVGLVLSVPPNMFPHVFQGATGLATEIAGMLARDWVCVPTLGPNLADRRRMYGIQQREDVSVPVLTVSTNILKIALQAVFRIRIR